MANTMDPTTKKTAPLGTLPHGTRVRLSGNPFVVYTVGAHLPNGRTSLSWVDWQTARKSRKAHSTSTVEVLS